MQILESFIKEWKRAAYSKHDALIIERNMFEFVGAIAGRSIMIEGTVNSISLLSTLLSFLMLNAVAHYTKEPILEYYFVLFKFTLAWMTLTSILGCIAIAQAGFKTIVDPHPKTRAWYEGPRLVCLALIDISRAVGYDPLGMLDQLFCQCSCP